MSRSPTPARGAAAVALTCAALAAFGGAGCGDRILWLPARDGGALDLGAADAADAVAPPDVSQPEVDTSMCATDLVGFATLSGGTTGGQGAPIVVVTNETDLRAATNTDGLLEIHIQGMIALPELMPLEVKPDKTIQGVGAASGLTGSGIFLKSTSNVIVRNLVINNTTGTGADDITVQASNHIWVDHCDLSAAVDSLIDINHASDYVTVSWTYFHDHDHDVSFIGHSDTNTADMTHLNVTWHHNLFKNAYEHSPSLRFGVVHAFNNHYVMVGNTGIVSRMGGQVLAERNYFENVHTPMSTVSDSPTDGFIEDIYNFEDAACGPSDITQSSEPALPYAYTPTPIEMVPVEVDGCVGTGKI
jgi:pectate lyase